jgi:hypothetical protein
MAREGDRSDAGRSIANLAGDYSRYASDRSLFDSADRDVFRPLPRSTGRQPRPVNRSYDRYFPRNASR